MTPISLGFQRLTMELLLVVFLIKFTSVGDRHRIRIRIKTARIRNTRYDADPDPYPTFYFDADPDLPLKVGQYNHIDY